MSTQFRPDSTTSLSQDGMDGISSGIASSGPQISMTTDPIASQTFPLGFLGSANHIDRLEGLYRMEIFYEKRQRQLAAMITPPVGPLSSPVSARNGSPFWRSFWSKTPGSGGSTPAAPDLTRATFCDLKPPISETQVTDTIQFTALSANGQE